MGYRKNIKMLVLAMLILVGGCLGGCADRKQGDAGLDAVLWSRATAEYDIIARQIFFQAERQLDGLVSQKSQTAVLEQGDNYQRLPVAVIVDIDDTVLSNADFHYQMLLQGIVPDEQAWANWMNQASAKPVPGALEYVSHAGRKGVTVFYITNRTETFREPTQQNLRRIGFPLADGKSHLLMRSGDNWEKTARRAGVAEGYRVIQVIGHSLGDFIPGTDDMTLAEQRDASNHYMAYWGEKWFMLPNPAYGDWESIILNGGDSSLPQGTLKARYRFIRGGESQGVW